MKETYPCGEKIKYAKIDSRGKPVHYWWDCHKCMRQHHSLHPESILRASPYYNKDGSADVNRKSEVEDEIRS